MRSAPDGWACDPRDANRGEIDRAVFHVEEQQVEARARHDLHNLRTRHGDDGAEGRLA